MYPLRDFLSSLPSGETMRQTPKALEVKERARGPLSPCQVWWVRISPADGVAKNVEIFCQSVCLSVRHAFERQSLCARFRHKGVGVQKRF